LAQLKEKGMTNSEKKLTAEASITIDAPVNEVWEAFVNPEIIRQYMFGTDVESDWEVGSSIVWRGEWKGTPYEDKGTILRMEQQKSLQYSHFSPLSGQPDTPANYHTVTVELTGQGSQTDVRLTQDNNEGEEAREHSARNWQTMLEEMKRVLENPAR